MHGGDLDLQIVVHILTMLPSLSGISQQYSPLGGMALLRRLSDNMTLPLLK